MTNILRINGEDIQLTRNNVIDITNVFIKSNLNIGKNVLFSGTPCQVAGLKSFLHKDFDNLITVDLICHCVPSPMVFKDYITFIEEKHKKKGFFK